MRATVITASGLEGMRMVDGVSTGLGFLLLELKPAVCIGVGLSPRGVGVIVVTNSLDCSTAGNATPDSGFTAGPPPLWTTAGRGTTPRRSWRRRPSPACGSTSPST